MKTKEIIRYLKDNVIPLPGHDKNTPLYRASAILVDGTELPCVVFRNPNPQVDLAIKRFDETREDKTLHESMNHRSIVKSFVCQHSAVSDYEIKELKPCPFAIPIDRISEIGGETAMGWTQFLGVMDDKKEFSFGTRLDEMFFNMPDGYTAERIVKIYPVPRELVSKYKEVYREKPHFECYVDGL